MTQWELLHGDCLEKLKDLSNCSVDAVVTDPPYEIGFMGRGWDASGIAYDVSLWREVLRVLKPGGHLLAFGATRTFHRMVCAVEDAGLEIRDSIHWIYGTGFPKSLDVSKALDKAAKVKRERVPLVGGALNSGTANGWNGSSPHSAAAPLAGTRQVDEPVTDSAREWHGWGTALKPAHEPVLVARKPLDGTVAANVLAHGVGGINVNGCRVGEAGGSKAGARVTKPDGRLVRWDEGHRGSRNKIESINAGRWPPNVVFSHLPACRLVGTKKVDGHKGYPNGPGGNKNQVVSIINGNEAWSAMPHAGHADADGKETVELWECAEGCAVAELEASAAGTSRFFPAFRYQAKAPAKERKVEGVEARHPTQKPIDLMRWLVRLVTPKGGLVLDPFTGSGTTGIAALLEGCRFIGCEREDEYIAIARARLEHALKKAISLQDRQATLFDLEVQ